MQKSCILSLLMIAVPNGAGEVTKNIKTMDWWQTRILVLRDLEFVIARSWLWQSGWHSGVVVVRLAQPRLAIGVVVVPLGWWEGGNLISVCHKAPEWDTDQRFAVESAMCVWVWRGWIKISQINLESFVKQTQDLANQSQDLTKQTQGLAK